MHHDYPHILFRKQWLIEPATMYELGECNAIIAAIANIPITPDQHQNLLNLSLTKGAQATTAIEGNTLTEDEINKIREGEASLPPSKKYQEQEVANILRAFNSIFQDVAVEGREELLTPEILRRFHQVIGENLGEHFDAIPGRFREDSRFVGTYRCPDWRDVPELVARLCSWLDHEFHYQHGQTFPDAVIEAIVSHIYVEWIHPFGDGNGRTGRLVEFYFLLRAGLPDIASHILSNHYNETRPVYYRQIDRATRDRDLTNFITYAVQGFRDGLLKTLELVQAAQFETAWKQYVHDTFGQRRSRQARASQPRLLDLALAMPLNKWVDVEEIILLSAPVARAYASLSRKTLIRDLASLLRMNLVLKSEGRYRASCDQLLNQKAKRAQRKLLRFGEPQPGTEAVKPSQTDETDDDTPTQLNLHP